MTRPRTFHQNPTLVDMTGKECGGYTVLYRAQNVDGNAVWWCRHSCGAHVTMLGIQLRSKPPQYCVTCRPRRPGTVRRVWR